MQQSDTLPAFVDLNILPEELRPRRYSILFLMRIVALVVASLALLPLYQAERDAGHETARLQSDLDRVSYDLALAQLDLGKLRGLQRQLEAVQTDLDALNEERQAVLGDSPGLSEGLSEAVSGLPAGGSLASVAGGGGRMTLTGQAATPDDVFAYARVLQTSQRISESRVVSLETATGEGGGSAVTFTIEAVR